MKKSICIFLLLYFCFRSNAQSSGGVLSGGVNVCSGANSGTLALSSYSGNIVRWETALGINGPWTPMVFTLPSYNFINLVQTSSFRVVVQLPGYAEAFSNAVTVSCAALSAGGTLMSETVTCINNAITCSLSGQTGAVIAWEYSQNNWITTASLSSNSASSVTMPSVNVNTAFRARVQNGNCPAVFSNTQVVQVLSQTIPGTIVGAANVCASSNTGTLLLNGYNGSVAQWESALNAGGPFNPIGGSGGNYSQVYINLAQPTFYRAQVRNGNCPAMYTGVAQVTVHPQSVGGNIIGSSSVCAGQNAGNLQLNNFFGNVVQWESSANSGQTWSTINNQSTTISTGILSSGSVYRCLLQSGNCAPVYSAWHAVNVSPLPVPVFSAMNGCAGSVITFSNVTSGLNYWQWDFNDGNGSMIFSPAHTFISPGTYSVKLVATSPAGCVDSVRQTISIYPRPQAAFQSADTVCYGGSILFSGSSNISWGSIAQVLFDFGDGNSSASSSVLHQYNGAGNYNAKLKVISNSGCADSITRTIKVFAKPVVGFSALPVCRGEAVQFVNSSFISEGSLQYSWSFGDGNGSAISSPTTVYAQAGMYNVSIIATSNHNCMDTSVGLARVFEKADLGILQNNVCMGQLMNFSTSILPVMNLQVSYNFGDGNFASVLSPSHGYATPGNFLVKVSAVSDSGCVSSAEKHVSVYAKPYAAFSAANVCEGDSTRLMNGSENNGYTYSWLLGGQGSSAAVNPVIVFNGAGIYQVQLIVATAQTCADTATRFVEVFKRPAAVFSYNNACEGLPVVFKDESTAGSGAIQSRNWNFGDHSFSSETDPQKLYLNPGAYFVELQVESSAGCSDSSGRWVLVYPQPVADFTASPVCEGEEMLFKNRSASDSTFFSSLWLFEEQKKSEAESPRYLFSGSGEKAVKLLVKTGHGCADSVIRFVTVMALPKTDAGRDTSFNKGTAVKLNAHGAVSYSWFPDIGLNSVVGAEVLAGPPKSQLYTVYGTDVNGCLSVDSVFVKLLDELLVIPYNIVTPDGNGLNDTWIVKHIESYPENEVLIVDQWGQVVLETEGYRNDWTGRNGQGEMLPDATYYYVLKFKNHDKIYKGSITLMRNRN